MSRLSKKDESNFFLDEISKSSGFFFGIKKKIIERKTEYQTIELVETFRYGQGLIIDGATQLLEKIEYEYHETLVHPALLGLNANNLKILTIGGGDGAIIREILKHDVKKVDHVEIDGGVVEFCKEYIPWASNGAFDDERVHLHLVDGFEYVKAYHSPNKEKYDCIIMDLTDPVGPSAELYTLPFFQLAKSILREDGVYVMHGECAFSQEEFFFNLFVTLKKVFKYVSVLRYPVRMYGGSWFFLQCSDSVNYHEEQIKNKKLSNQFLQIKSLHGLKALDEKMFDGLFILPPILRNKFGKKGKIIHSVSEIGYEV